MHIVYNWLVDLVGPKLFGISTPEHDQDVMIMDFQTFCASF